MEIIREKGVTLTADAIIRLNALPDTFREFAHAPQEGAGKARKPVEGTQTPEKPVIETAAGPGSRLRPGRRLVSGTGQQ